MFTAEQLARAAGNSEDDEVVVVYDLGEDVTDKTDAGSPTVEPAALDDAETVEAPGSGVDG